MIRAYEIFVPWPFPPIDDPAFHDLSEAYAAFRRAEGTRDSTVFISGHGTTWRGSYPEDAALEGSRLEEALVRYSQAAGPGGRAWSRAFALTIAEA